MSTAMDSWSGFRVHNVIFHHVSVPPKLTAFQPVFVSRSNSASLCLSFVSLCVRAEGKTGNLAITTTTKSNIQLREEEEMEKR